MLGFDNLADLQKTINLEMDSYLKSNRSRFISEAEKHTVVSDYEDTWFRKDGTPIQIVENARIIVDKQTAKKLYEGSVIDITEKKINEQKIAQQYESLKDLNHTTNKIISIIAHDLYNPFNALLNFSDTLKNNYSNLSEDKRMMYVDYIGETTRQAKLLLDNLLDWGRAQTGRIDLVIQDFSIQPLINQIIIQVQQLADNKLLQLKSTINQDILVHADTKTCEIIFRNLISNAIKFTEIEGEILLSGRIVKHSDTNYFYEISVEDKGIGMSESKQENLFLINHKSSTGTNGEEGSGLGLLLCKEFVEKNNGIIRVESTLGLGSTFFVSLPLNIKYLAYYNQPIYNLQGEIISADYANQSVTSLAI